MEQNANTATLPKRYPRVSRNQTRTRAISISISADEKDAIAKSAESAGMSASRYCRYRALSLPISNRIDRLALADLLRRTLENTDNLKSLGNNLNQLTKIANGKGVLPAGLTELQSALEVQFKHADEIRRLIIQAMSKDNLQ